LALPHVARVHRPASARVGRRGKGHVSSRPLRHPTSSRRFLSMTAREAIRIVTAHRQREGGGFVVRRPVPTLGMDMVHPFLLIDEMGPVDYGPGQAIGAPDHPHRGFETVTYVLDGEMEHEDSAGHRGALGPGDVQWM